MFVNTFNQLKSLAIYLVFLFLVIALFDVIILHEFLGFGYPEHFEQGNVHRYPAPYVEFTGKPGTGDHNDLGFRGPSLKDARDEDMKIAFFGGSTGYMGTPSIAGIVESELKALLNRSVFVANYSVVSSHHRQHLHGIIEFLFNFKPDLVIFYGGYNETLQSAYYDPRPGYPYNFYYRAETSPFIKLLLENSAIFGEIDKKTGLLSGLKDLQRKQEVFSGAWNRRIIDKYFETLEIAFRVVNTMESRHFSNTRFMAFYQPYQVPENFITVHDEIKKRIPALDYVFDVSNEYDILGKSVYKDIVHVSQEAKKIMGARIAHIITRELQRK